MTNEGHRREELRTTGASPRFRAGWAPWNAALERLKRVPGPYPAAWTCATNSTELRKAGALYESATAFRDVFATHVVVDEEKRFVTAQNQNSGRETAHKMMKLIAKRSRP